jgi:hypothetical protein
VSVRLGQNTDQISGEMAMNNKMMLFALGYVLLLASLGLVLDLSIAAIRSKWNRDNRQANTSHKWLGRSLTSGVQLRDCVCVTGVT